MAVAVASGEDLLYLVIAPVIQPGLIDMVEGRLMLDYHEGGLHG